MNLVALLVWLLVFCIVYWAATRILAAFGVGEPIHTVVIVILVIVGLYILLGQLGVGLPSLR